MIPAFSYRRYESLIPEFRALPFDERVPTSPGVQVTTPERTRHFDIYVQGALDQGFYHNVEHGISRHLDAYRFLNTLELEAIATVIDTLEDEIQDIGSNITESQDVIGYTRMLLRSREPEDVLHRQIYKQQLEVSRNKYKDFMRILDRYHKEIGKLRAIYSKETLLYMG
ncbi:uncharacterized protein MELLADRAFT_113735 [Melampsora larici-populina 98AG31]|uniref:Uncharacterized protein n=1 Tax=Melampsora larici-populina (strain 98AG31 / pathotype 3-4-7) TaxID=747676 RepID=F4SAW8_MELLP|nr:uncharacterized protein MELLADRAFT_113735 [Melampsora larici-populina 98AG31]EGF98179.1 hypothetical protein MELLADRAFT_113735 [Melampsora larici-populina 98AG31]